MALRIHREEAEANLSYLAAGEGPVPVLLVHGNFAGKRWWRELLEDPPPDSRLIAPDLPGFGESPGGRGFRPSITRYARALSRFLDARGIGQTILLGHSFGAAVTTELALSDPDRFPAMFLLSPAPPDGLYTSEYLYPLLESYRFDRRGLKDAMRRVIRTRVPAYFEELITEAQQMHPASFSGNARVLSDWDATERLHLYKNPVLVASGARDALVPPRYARATARAFPVGAYASLGNVAHGPQVEAPSLLRDLLAHFLKAVANLSR